MEPTTTVSAICQLPYLGHRQATCYCSGGAKPCVLMPRVTRVMEADPPDWRKTLLHELAVRNRREVAPFARLVESFNQAHRQNIALKTQNAYQEKELIIMRHEAGTTAAESRDEKVAKLQRKVQQLQEELNHMFRIEREGATSQLNLSAELHEMGKRSLQTRQELEAVSTELEGYKEREPKQLQELEHLRADLELVKGELHRVQRMLEASETERMEVRKQNDELIERIVGEKSRNAEEMNKMNETVEQLRAQVASLQVQLAAAGGQAARPDSRGSGAGGSRSRGTSLDASGGSTSSMASAAAGVLPSTCTAQFKAHTGDVNDLAYSPTGGFFATAGSDALVRVWHGTSGKLVTTLRGGAEPMLSVDLVDDRAVAGSSDNSVRLWDVRTGRCSKTYVGHSGNVYAARFIEDGKSIITGSADRTVRVWDAARAVVKQVMRSGSTCNGLDISVDGTVPVSAHQDGQIRLWDLRAGNATAMIRAFETQATSVSYGKDFTVLANSRDNVIKVVDTRTYETLYTLRHADYRTVLNWSRACWSPSNGLVAAGSGNSTLMLWGLRSGEVKVALSGHPGPLTNVAWWGGGSEGDLRLASCDRTGHVCLWN